MFQIWQVPFERPVSFRDAQMIMTGVSQSFPAPGSLSARATSKEKEATLEEATLADRARDLVRDVSHAYADLTEAASRRAAHTAHHDVAERLLAAAQARQSAGGALDDVAQTQLELARLDADVATEAAALIRARARLNGFLGRPFDAPLGAPSAAPPEVAALPATALVARAERARPDLRAAHARVEAEGAMLTSARREATWPSFTVGASYFAPTTASPVHGYGLSASASLPWVWGGNARREEAQEASARAASFDADDARLRVGVDVGTAAAAADAAAERLLSLSSRARPAAKRALDLGFASYGAGKGELLGVLRAEQAAIDVEMDIVAARASLDHALADLDWAVGEPVPRVPLELPMKAGEPQ
jgi:outer membrane protein TolC